MADALAERHEHLLVDEGREVDGDDAGDQTVVASSGHEGIARPQRMADQQGRTGAEMTDQRLDVVGIVTGRVPGRGLRAAPVAAHVDADQTKVIGQSFHQRQEHIGVGGDAVQQDGERSLADCDGVQGHAVQGILEGLEVHQLPGMIPGFRLMQ